jgi:SAM-dependent methyltransferase
VTHPEEAAAVQWMTGRTVEVGAGSNPTPGSDVTVDHTPAGQPGDAGCEAGKTSVADITADMANLPFDDGEFDTLIARHVLEHHPDTLTVLREWARVAHRLVVICPDQGTFDGNTIRLDPTHCAAFTKYQLAALARHAGLEPATYPVIAGWSFLMMAERVPTTHNPSDQGIA